jgi:hypothetical protein
LAAKKVDRNLPAMLRIALQAGKLSHRLVLWQILVADSLKLLAPPTAGIGAELFDARPLEFAYALRNGRVVFIALISFSDCSSILGN